MTSPYEARPCGAGTCVPCTRPSRLPFATRGVSESDDCRAEICRTERSYFRGSCVPWVDQSRARLGLGRERERVSARVVAWIRITPDAHANHAMLLLSLGRNDDAIAASRRAQALDPVSPIIATLFGVTLLMSDYEEEAIEQLKNALVLESDQVVAHQYLARAYRYCGRFDLAMDEGESSHTVAGKSICQGRAGACTCGIRPKRYGARDSRRADSRVRANTPGRVLHRQCLCLSRGSR